MDIFLCLKYIYEFYHISLFIYSINVEYHRNKQRDSWCFSASHLFLSLLLHKLHFSSIIQFASLGSFYPDTINDIRCMVLLQFFFLYFSLSPEKVMHTYGRTDRRTTLSVEVASGLKWIDGQRIKWCFRDLKFTWYPYTYVFMKHVFVHIIFC